MTFLHPWAIIIGVLAAGIPVAVHFLTKPRPVRLPLSTLRFLREAIQQRRARSVLRDVLILTLRTLAVLSIALAIARPQWGSRPLISDKLEGDAVRIVALDVSQSMAATDRGVAALERARSRAAEFLRYRPGLKANLILIGAESRGVFDAPSVNFDQLRQELSQVDALPQRVDVRKFVETAGKMLAPISPDDRRRRELIIISDFQRSGWAKVDLASLPEGTQIQWESVAAQATLPNLAVVDVRVNTWESVGDVSQCEIDVYNGSNRQRQVEIELQLGQSLWNLKTNCPPETTTTLLQELRMQELRRPSDQSQTAQPAADKSTSDKLSQNGWLAGKVRLLDVDDALAADDVRPFVVHIPTEPVFALITRQSAKQRPSSSWFLECMLALRQSDQEKITDTLPEESSQGGVRRQTNRGQSSSVHRIDPSDIETASLASSDLILLDHPGKLSDDVIKLLAGFLRRGRPMLYVASEPSDAANLKSLLDAVKENIQLSVEFVPLYAGRSRRDATLISVKRDRPPFNVFGDQLGAVQGRLRFAGGLETRRLPGLPDDDLTAVYNDGSACIVSAISDSGALAILNADLNDSNLAKTGAFVPLIEELTRSLIYRQRRNTTANCGESIFVQLPGDVGPSAALELFDLNATKTIGKDDRRNDRQDEDRFGRLLDEETGTVWDWNEPERPGVFGVRRGENTVYAQSVAIPPEESELETLDMQMLAPRLTGGHATYFRNVSGNERRRDDFWVWFAVTCVVCMLGEIGTMIVFRD